MSSLMLPRWVRAHHVGRLLGACPAFGANHLSLQGSSNSYAIKKKDELERVAKSNR